MKRLFLFVLLAVSLCACQSSVFKEMTIIPNQTWKKDSPVVFNAEISEPNMPLRAKLVLRHDPNTVYGELNMKMTYTSPSGKTEDKYFTMEIRDKDGNLKGDAAGMICDTEMVVIDSFVLKEKGKYLFKVYHEMEDTILPLMSDLTLTLEKIEKK